MMLDVQRGAATAVGAVLRGRSLDTELATVGEEAGLDPSERAALKDLSFGTLRHLGRLDLYLDELLDRPLKDERLRCLLRVAIYQLEYSKTAPHVIVDQAVHACRGWRLEAAANLVNAILRNYQRRRSALAAAAEKTDVARFSYAQWWIDKLREQHPDTYAKILDAGNTHPPLTLRVNRRRCDVPAYLHKLAGEGIDATQTGPSAVLLKKPRPVETIPGFAEGLVSVQDLGAQYAAALLDLAPGQRVLDACAAPGGKAAHLCEQADIELFALDIDAARVARIASNLTRLGLSAHLVLGDAANPPAWWDGREFSHILADVPCSASGVVRRHPDIKWLRRASDIPRMVEAQKRLLDTLWPLLASGGKLLYATCSVFREENDLQIADFLERRRDARLLPPPVAELHHSRPPGQLFPDALHDGFYYALLQKI
jgi:16S rRNA (cytosine967-C5)-methyltransferase